MVSGEKRNCEGENVMEKINTILLDIEGTTTSISFVKDVLFPYVRENLKTYVESHWDEEEFKADLKALKDQAQKDEESKIENFCPIEEGENEKESLMKNVLWQMDLDKKTTALKQLQGHIWREGYENGKLKGHVYSEVAPTFKKWCEDGRKLFIFSSGSVEAQKLLFKNSENGDLLSYLTGHFDTEVGPKTEASSYTTIAKAIGCDCSQILFLTDVVKEAVAADKAGMQVTIVIRDGNVPLTDDDKKAFPTITSFKELVFESSIKKKKICEEENTDDSNNKTQNEENVQESEVENGKEEKMEVETNEVNTENKDCIPEKTENDAQAETESNTAMETDRSNEVEIEKIKEVESDKNNEVETGKNNEVETDKTNEVETDKNKEVETDRNNEVKQEKNNEVETDKNNEVETENVDVDIDDSNTGDSTAEEKVVSSSVEDSNTVNDETANGTDKEAPEEEKETETVETNNEKQEDTKDSATSLPEKSEEVKETVEESSADTAQEPAKEKEKVTEETKEVLNGHENEIEKENNLKDASAEVNGEANEKTSEGEVSETVSVNKVISEEQADSTIEVTA